MIPEKKPLKFDEIQIGITVIDEEELIGVVSKIDTVHNILVKYKNGGSGLYCLDENCLEGETLFLYDVNKLNKHKMILDPNADGTQWIYREMGIQEQNHPSLLPYTCYDWSRSSFIIGEASKKSDCRKIIDAYIADGKNWIFYKTIDTIKK